MQATWPQIGTFTGFGGAVFDAGRPDNEASFGVDTITLDGTGAPSGLTIPGTEFYVDLGLKSDLFSVTSTGNNTVAIEGQGWGHGIGMGQWGALGYAIGQDNGDGNWTYQQIVDHYYGPAQLTSLPGGRRRPPVRAGASADTGSTPPTGACSASATHSSTAARAACDSTSPWSPWRQRTTPGGPREIASDGGVFSFGDAQFHGSTGNIRLNRPIVGMAVTPDGGGYWLVASDGGVFTFGDAGFYGKHGDNLVLNKPVIGDGAPPTTGWATGSSRPTAASSCSATPASSARSAGRRPPPGSSVWPLTPDGGGYWVLGANGTVYDFGDAPQVGVAAGSPTPATMKSAMTGLVPDFSGQGFDAVNGSGQAFAYGDAPWFGRHHRGERIFRGTPSASPSPRAEAVTSERRGNRRSRPKGPRRPASTPWSAALSRRRSPRPSP